MAQLRPETDIPGLYLTGQDAMLCGFPGALVGGLACSAAILKRNLFLDIENLHAKLQKQKTTENNNNRK